MSLNRITRLLQRRFAEIDSIYEQRRPTRADSFELLLLKLKDIKIKLYQEVGHKLPHIHIDYGKEHHAASYSIQDMRRLEGSLPTRYENIISAWLSENRDLIIKIWNEVQSGGNPGLLIEKISENA